MIVKSKGSRAYQVLDLSQVFYVEKMDSISRIKKAYEISLVQMCLAFYVLQKVT